MAGRSIRIEALGFHLSGTFRLNSGDEYSPDIRELGLDPLHDLELRDRGRPNRRRGKRRWCRRHEQLRRGGEHRGEVEEILELTIDKGLEGACPGTHVAEVDARRFAHLTPPLGEEGECFLYHVEISNS